VNLKSFTVCVMRDHKWATVAYQPMVSGTGYFRRCQRCGKEAHNAVSWEGLTPKWPSRE